ncbi:hypothetical protein F4803DRAFT_506291 [Xylaria telfairii]|nr:hypothetical protein F4803DRAFT_506291 [Xylaria telfairii]
MKTITVVLRAVLLVYLVALVVTRVNAQGPSLGGLATWPPGSSDPYASDPNDDDPHNSTDSGSDNSGNSSGDSSSSDSGSGSASGNSGNEANSGNGNDNGNGGYGGNIGGSYGGGSYGGGSYGGYSGNGFGGYGGSPSSFGPGLDGLNDSLEYQSLLSYRVAHGALAALAFGFLFPLGAILLRTVPGAGAFPSHWVIQMIAWVLYIIAAGLGLYLLSIVRIPSGAGLLEIAKGNAHPIIGIVLLVFMLFQPVFGVVHHRRFKRLHRRTWASHVHLWTGRLSITLGIINGGLGLALAGVTGAPVIAYSVISGFMWILWVLTTLIWARRDSNAQKNREDSERREKITEDSGYVPPRGRSDGAGSGTAAPRVDNSVLHDRNNAAYSHPAGVPIAEQEIPSPPYTPGPNYEVHMAHMRLQRQRQGDRGEMQNIKEAMDRSDTVSIISASQDEMRRGQV